MFFSSLFSPRAAVRALVAVSLLAFTHSLALGDDVKKHFDAGVKLYQEHKLEAAISEFNSALKGDPKDPNILRWIGFLQLERQNFEAAREPLEQAVTLDPNSAVSHINLGNVYDGLKLYPKALDEFRKVTRLRPDSADAFFNIGLIDSKLGRWSDAGEALRTAARLDAAAAVKANQPGRHEDPAIQDALGTALLNGNDARGAATAYQRAVSLQPDSAEYNYHLGLAWRRVADGKHGAGESPLTSARKALKSAVGLEPGNYEYTELYAEVLFDLNSNSEAAETFLRASELDRSQYNPVYNLAIAYTRIGRFADAEKAYARALALVKPGESAQLRRNALNGLTVSQMKQKKFDEAIVNLKSATSEFPSDTVAWVNLAAAFRNKGDEAEQIAALKGAIANGTGYGNLPMVRSALGALLYKRDDLQGAAEQYTLANRALPNTADILNGLALTEERQGHVDEAIRDFQAAVKANPHFADACNNLGVAYEARYRVSNDKGDLDRALAAYNQALTLDPHHALARKNRDRFDKSRRP